MVKNVEELNALAGEGLGEVQKTADGARIKVRIGYRKYLNRTSRYTPC